MKGEDDKVWGETKQYDKEFKMLRQTGGKKTRMKKQKRIKRKDGG